MRKFDTLTHKNIFFMHQQQRKTCQNCDTEIHYFDRLDKKFCSNRCRNMFHNRNKADVRGQRKKISDILEKNYAILKRYQNKTAKIADLKFLGYQEDYFTHVQRDKSNRIIAHVVWDLAVQAINNNDVKIFTL